MPETSHTPRRRYRRYLEPGSTENVPRQTLKYITKRGKASNPAKRCASSPNPASTSSITDGPSTSRLVCNTAESSIRGSFNPLSSSTDVGSTGSPTRSEEIMDDNRSEESAVVGPCGGSASNPTCSSDGHAVAPGAIDSRPIDDSSEREDIPSRTNEELLDDSEVEDEGLDDDEGGDTGGPEFIDDFKRYFGKLSEETLPHQSTTKAEALLLVLAYIVTAGLSWSQVRGLLILINALFGQDVIPRTTYLIRKLWRNKKNALKYELFCQLCHNYLGSSHELRNSTLVTCGSCSTEKTLRSLMSCGSFFLVFDLRQQILDLVKQVSGILFESLQKLSSSPRTLGRYADITDGDLYWSVRSQMKMKWSDITLTFNTDGAPVFESSKSSIWPIQIMINELPVQVRWQNVLISALWFSKIHPPMHLFMTRFVEEASKIGTITWSHAGRLVKSAVHPIVCCADSPARAAILNMKQYNGYFSCSWCFVEGLPVDGAMKFLCGNQQAPGRTHGEVMKAMVRAARSNETVWGIRGPSPLIKLKGLDLVWGLPPDYMHCVLEGVTKQLTDLWLSASYIGRHIKLLDSRVCAIKPPITFSRIGRPLSERTFWKATEWQYWLLFYSIPCISGVLDHTYTAHFALFVKAVFLLLKDVVMESDICEAEKLIFKFVHQMAKLYEDPAMTFNVHILLHLAKSTRMFGPLWSTSTFPFEDGNGRALQLVTAAKHVPMQIAERCIMQNTYHALSKHLELSAHVASAKEDIELKYQRRSQTSVLGLPQSLSSMPEQLKRLFDERFGFVPEVCKYFRAQVGKSVVHTSDYTVPKKTCSCYVKMSDGTYCCVLGIYVIGGMIHFHCQSLLATPNVFDVPHIVQCRHPPAAENHSLFPCSDFAVPCVFITVDNISYLCELPNTQEKD